MNKNRYHINVFYSEDDEGFIADVPDLKRCSAFGDTPQKAMEEIMIAMQLWLDSARDCGLPIPEAKYKPFIYQVSRV
jgi:predicted RNase H-like HicB family nuclease